MRRRQRSRVPPFRGNAEPAEQPAFYAYTVYPGSCSTLGGAMKNEHGQVLDVFAEQPIPRLYGAGSFGNIHSHTYGITGGNVAENMIWGRISARHAAALDAWDEKK
nr:FAD-binding protein [Eggerthella sinensis]